LKANEQIEKLIQSYDIFSVLASFEKILLPKLLVFLMWVLRVHNLFHATYIVKLRYIQ